MDYTRQDFTQSGETYDVVFDAVGKLAPAQGKKALKPGGVYINVHADSYGGDKLENLLVIKELVEAGKAKPAIDRVYPLEQIVEAHRYVEQGHKKGNVVVCVNCVPVCFGRMAPGYFPNCLAMAQPGIWQAFRWCW